MPEPARQYTASDAAGRSATAPLRDWLAQIRTQAAQSAPEPVRAEPQRAAAAERRSWEPRFVAPPVEPQREEMPAVGEALDPDIAELMAENMLLKAQLRLEGERYADLQAQLAEEIRELRRHVEAELSTLAELRDERDLWRARAEALAQPLFQAR